MFCNDGTWKLTNNYTIMIEPGQKQDVCIYIQNKSNKDVFVKYSFPKWEFSKVWNQICDVWDDFAKFLLDNPKRELVVPWNSSVILKETVSPPPWQIGMYYGCLAYQLWEPEVQWMWWVFNLVVRKTVSLNLFVGSENSILNAIQLVPVTGSVYSLNKNIGWYFDDNGDFILKFGIKNNWNLTQNVSLSGKMYNPLGLEKTFSLESKKLLPGDLYETSFNMGMIPFYKWLFSVRANLFAQPHFEFDVSSIGDEHKKPTFIKEQWSLFIFSWIYVVLVLVIIAIIVKIVLPKKKKLENN